MNAPTTKVLVGILGVYVAYTVVVGLHKEFATRRL